MPTPADTDPTRPVPLPDPAVEGGSVPPTGPRPVVPQRPRAPRSPSPARRSSPRRAVGSAAQSGAGFVLGLYLFVQVLVYVRGGLPAVKAWHRAKFTNQTDTATPLAPATPATPATPGAPAPADPLTLPSPYLPPDPVGVTE